MTNLRSILSVTRRKKRERGKSSFTASKKII
jgi:hypothetical protein